MTMEFTQLLELLKPVAIDGYRHKHYDHTKKVAKWCYQMMTGDDQREYLVQYKNSETGEQKENRIKIYSSLTQYVSHKTMKAFDAVKRVDNIKEVLEYPEQGETQTKKIEEIRERLAKFYNNSHAKNYLHEAFQFFNFYDPNGFLVIEMENLDQLEKDVWTYPLEVTSKEAVDYKRRNGDLQYLTIMLPCKYKEKTDKNEVEEKEGCAYTIYAADKAIRITELGEPGKAVVPEGIGTIELKSEQSDKATLFRYEEFETKSKVVPAIQFGYLKDPRTQRQTFVSPLYPAEKILKDLIITKSEYDLAKALHGFLQKFAFAEPCDFSMRPEKGPRLNCNEGIMTDGSECPACKGTGYKLHHTVQDVILYELPRQGEGNGIKLADMVHYQEIPDHLIKAQKEDCEELANKVSKAVFNTEIFERSQVVETATAKRIDLDSVYNVLSEYSDHFALMYKFIVYITAVHLKNDDELSNEYVFPHDFKLESLMELIINRAEMVKAGVPMDAIFKQDLAIIERQYADDAETIARMAARLSWKPFYDKRENELMYVISTLDDDDFEKVLWTYYDRIMTDIENEKTKHKFHELDYSDQKEIIEKKVGEYQEKIRESIEKRTPPAFSPFG